MKKILFLLLASCAWGQTSITGNGSITGNTQGGATPAPICSILTSSLPNSSFNTSYSQTVVTQNCPSPTFARVVGPGGDFPPGWSLNPSTGVISGTDSTTVGAYSFAIKVTNVAPFPTQTYHVSVACASLSIISPSIFQPATVNIPFNQTIQTQGGYGTLTFSSSGLPTGESINSSTGAITGTPTVVGNYTPTITVHDSCPAVQTISSTFSASVAPQTLAITTASVNNDVVGNAPSIPFNASGGTLPYTWSSSGTLPPGLSLNASTGVLAGTLTTAGTYTYTITVTDNAAATASRTYTQVISAAPPSCAVLTNTTVSLPNATQGQAYPSTQMTSTGGSGAKTWSSGGLPTGMSLSSGGLLTGTPTTSGVFQVDITVTDSCSPTPQSDTNTVSLIVNAAASTLTMVTTAIKTGTVGVPFSDQMVASGGVTPYTWAKTSGSFPTGVSMSSAGTFSGTPTTAGTSTLAINVTDNASTVVGPNTFSMVVNCPTLAITQVSIPTATIGAAFSFQMTLASPGTGSVSWGATGLPTSLSMNSSGAISGTPTVSGTFPNVVVTATDSCSPAVVVSKTFSMQVNSAALGITTSSVPFGVVGQVYSFTLGGTGGTLPYTWSLPVGQTLPNGLTLSSAGVISGTPTASGSMTFTVQLADSASHTVTQTYTIAINSATGAHNEYCTPAGTWIGATTDGPASLPRACNNTALANTPANGKVWPAVSSLAALQTTYASAACGDRIQLAAGSTFSGWVPSPKGCDDLHWIWIMSTGVNSPSFPAEGTRATPCQSNTPSMINRPAYPCTSPQTLTAQFVATSATSAIRLNGVDHLRFIGVELTRVPTPKTPIYQIVDMSSSTGTQTNHVIFDRYWCHGVEGAGTFPQSTTTDTSTTRCFYLGQSNHVSAIDGYISDFYDNSSASSNGNTDAQCIAGGFGGVPNSGWGVYKFVNNHCEASGEGILIGGSSGPPLTPSGCTILVNCNVDTPTDIEVRLNYFFKPPQWNGNTAVPGSTGWPVVKNGWEMKTGVRALFEGNVVENCWYNAQGCSMFNVAPVNQQSGGSPSVGTCPTCGVTDFTYRYNYSYNVANGIAVYAFMGAGCSSCQSQGMNRVSIHDNVIGDNLNLGNLTARSSGDDIELLAVNDSTNRGLNKMQNVTISHNTFVRSIRGTFVFGGAVGNTQMVNLVLQNNLWSYGNFGWVAVGNAGDCESTSGGSFYVALNNCTTGYTVDHNAQFNVQGTLGKNWPTNGSGLGNFFYSNSSGPGFTSYGTGDSLFNPSNYKLLPSSPLHNAASDGTDVGADITTLQSKIAGVRQ